MTSKALEATTMYWRLKGRLESHLAPLQLACRAGCSSCCHHDVVVTDQEAWAIAQTIRHLQPSRVGRVPAERTHQAAVGELEMIRNPGASFMTISGVTLFVGIVLVAANAVRERPVYVDEHIPDAISEVVRTATTVSVPLPEAHSVETDQTLGGWWMSLFYSGMTHDEIARVFVARKYSVDDWDKPLTSANSAALARFEKETDRGSKKTKRAIVSAVQADEPVVAIQTDPQPAVVVVKADSVAFKKIRWCYQRESGSFTCAPSMARCIEMADLFSGFGPEVCSEDVEDRDAGL